MILKRLIDNNPNIKFYTLGNVCDLYKKIDYDFSQIILQSEKLPVCKQNSYIADDDDLNKTDIVKYVFENVFAELPIQAGWCYGGNNLMNGMEWHKSSEVVIACTNCVLLIGDNKDIVNGLYDSGKAFGLFLKKGEAVELLPLTLHLAPLPIDGYFKICVILPKGTNTPLSSGIDGMLRAVNKWLLIHKDNQKGKELGGKIGVIGENITLNVN